MIKKAVIPAAGFGTRFLPAAKAVPKEMLPVVDKPVIQYVVEEAVAAGITDIIIVISRGKRAIVEHFDRHFELEALLESKGRDSDAAALRRISEQASIHYVFQPQMRGLGDAVRCARHHVGQEPFAVLLGDTIIESSCAATRQLIDVYERFGTSVVAVEEVPLERVSRYGVIRGEEIAERVWRVLDLVEKPAAAEAPSRLAVCSRYLLTADIFDKLDQTLPGKGGEIQLTDALRLQARERPFHACRIEAVRHDVGDALGFLKANLKLALARPDLRADVLALLHDISLVGKNCLTDPLK